MAKSSKFCISFCTISFCFCVIIWEVSTLVIAIYFAIGGLREPKSLVAVQQCLIAILAVLGAQFLIGLLFACLAISCCCFTTILWTELHEIRSNFGDTWGDGGNGSFRASSRLFDYSSLNLDFQDRFQGYVPFTESREFSVSMPPSYSQFAQSN